MEKIDFKDYPNTDTPINAENLNEMQDNIENDINAIIESGSNANGNYVKYADGTLVCYNRISVTTGITTAIGAFYRSGILSMPNYPINFIGENPVTTIQIEPNDSGDFMFIVTYGWGTKPTLTNIGRITVAQLTSVPNVSFYLTYTAIGRWK